MSLEHSPTNDDDLEVGTIKQACKIIGGEQSPISVASFYRGVKRGLYAPPFHPSPGCSRVNLADVRRRVRERASAG